jgi:Type IV secretion-system coupling protein DNA-binding domain
MLSSGVNALIHGWSGLVLGYSVVGGPMLAAMVKGRARLQKLLWSPVLAIPVTLMAGVATAAIQPVLRGLGMATGGLMQLAAGVGVSAAVGYVSGRVMSRSSTSSTSYRRGTLIVDAEALEPARPARASERSDSWRLRDRAAMLTLAGNPVPYEDETKHFKLIGTTGTGKSTAIRELLSAALERGDRAVIADPDGGYLKRFYDERRGDVILNPFEERAAKWDLYGEITNNYDIDQLARSLIPEGEGSERSWRAYARTFFRAVMQQTRDAGVEDVSVLYHLLVGADTQELRTLVEGTPAQPFLDEHNSRMFDSIRSVASSAVGGLEHIGQQSGSLQSVRSWVNSGRGVLFLPYQAGQIAALRSMISAWMRLAIFETMNRDEGDRRLWFVVDELDALGQIDGLKDALARLRKFGGRCVLGFQSIAQVSGTYGHAEAQTIVENCGNTLILRCSGSERGGTSSFASQLIGQREVIRTTESRSRQPLHLLATITRSEQPNIEPAVLDSEIEQLPDLKGYLKLASTPHWRRVALLPATVAHAGGMAQQVRSFARKTWEVLRVAGTAKDGASAAREPSNHHSSEARGQTRPSDGFDR